MSLTALPSGLQPAYHPSGEIRSVAHPGILLPGTNVNIFKNQPVGLGIGTGGAVNGVTVPVGQVYLFPIVAATIATTNKIFGVFAGCEYFDALNTPQESNYWPASQVCFAGTVITAFIWHDPLIEYTIQTDGTAFAGAAVTTLGDGYSRWDGRQLSLSNFAAGSATVGLSQCTASPTTLVAQGAQGQLQITKTDPTILNQTAGDTYLQLQVRIAYPATSAIFTSI
jgi:hypothetical protein